MRWNIKSSIETEPPKFESIISLSSEKYGTNISP